MLWKKCVEKWTNKIQNNFLCPELLLLLFFKKEEQQELKITQVAESD